MKATTRTCPECSSSFQGKGRRLTCSEACSKARQNRQLDELAARRKAANTASHEGVCDICGNDFEAKHCNHKYCSDPCVAEGLLRAIRCQRSRREAAKSVKR